MKRFVKALLVINFLCVSSCFLEESGQVGRKEHGLLQTLEDHCNPRVKQPRPTSPTKSWTLWGAKCSGDTAIPQQGGMCPYMQTSLQCVTKTLLNSREQKRSHLSKRKPSLNELYLKRGYCFLSMTERYWWIPLLLMTNNMTFVKRFWNFGRGKICFTGEEGFVLQVQFSGEIVHLVDLIPYWKEKV